MDNIWAIILAAGASTRMKKQKMMLPFNGTTIIETVMENVTRVVDEKIVVVLGSDKNEIEEQIAHTKVKTSFNNNYMEGMLSSVICGLNSVPERAEAVMIFLGDQPQISTKVAEQVIENWKMSNKGIVIPTFNNRRGHPALIEIKYKEEIEELDPEKGLRSLYQKFTDDILEVECDASEILRDIDTPEDYKKEMNLNK